MTQFAEDRAGMFETVADGPEELAALKAGFTAWNKLRFTHGDSLRRKMLLLF